jgi:hypothetical protein
MGVRVMVRRARGLRRVKIVGVVGVVRGVWMEGWVGVWGWVTGPWRRLGLAVPSCRLRVQPRVQAGVYWIVKDLRRFMWQLI